MQNAYIKGDHMAYNAKAQLKYNQKCNSIGVKFTLNEEKEYNRLKRYVEENDMSVNSYVKKLIKNDLDSKGIPYND